MTTNIFESIRQDHDEHRELLRKLVRTQGDSETRQSLFEDLKDLLARHADAEERHFYIPLIRSDMTQEKARHSIAEHHEIDSLIEALEETELSSPGWLATAKRLTEIVNHHLDEEEHEVFQLAGKTLTEEQKRSLAAQYREAMGATPA